MEDYKSNSDKSKKEEIEHRVNKVVNGGVTVKKKSELKKFSDVFISEDISSVKTYIFKDVLIPSITKALYDMVVGGAGMLFGQGPKNSNSGYKPSYRSYYDNRDREPVQNTARAYSYDDIQFNTRGDAEYVLNEMRFILDKYGYVRVLDLYDLVGERVNYTDNRYGWNDLRTAYVERVRGVYIIKLPRVIPL